MNDGPRPSRKRRRALITLALLVCGAQVGAADPDIPPGWAELASSFDAIAANDEIVGAAIALVQDGRIVAQHHYGYADLEGGRRVDPDTIFHWGSISKTLNAVSIMQLRDRGHLSLEDSVTSYLPELRQVHNPWGPMDAITLAMLMEHSAGFQAPTWPYKANKPWEPFEPTRWEQLVAMMPYQEIAFPPGSRFGYSNPTWIYLARILEQETGDPWDAYVHKNIFMPLGMSRSYFRLTPWHLRGHRSHNYSVERGEDGKPRIVDHGSEFDTGITTPNGGWNAPLADVATYVGFLTGAGPGQEDLQRRYDTVLERATLEGMWQPRQNVSDDGRERMGLGFFIIGSGENRVIGHTGGQANFSSMMYFNPRTRQGVVASFNTENRLGGERPQYFRAVRRQVLELLQ